MVVDAGRRRGHRAGGHVVEFNEPICITLITISFSAGVDLGTDVPIPVNDLPGTVQFRYYLNDVFLTYTDVPRTMRRGACSATPCSPAAAGSLSSSSTGTNTLADLAGVRATMKFDTAPGWLTRENVEVRTLEGTARPVSSSTGMTYPTLLPRTSVSIGRSRSTPSTRPTADRLDDDDRRPAVRADRDFDLLATSRTIAGPLVRRSTTGSDPDAAEIRLVVEASASGLIPRPAAKVRKGSRSCRSDSGPSRLSR